MRVVVGENSSTSHPVTSGVPQGSVIGPLLFIAYINKIATLTLSQSSNVILYADDLVYTKPLDTPESNHDIQADVNTISAEFENLSLRLNKKKCSYVIFSLCRRPDEERSINISLMNEPLRNLHSYRYLGMIFDSSLSYHEQVNAVTSKAKRGISALSAAIRKWAPRSILSCALCVIALPALLYGIEIWFPPDNGGRKKIEKIQKYAARLVLNNFNHDADYEEMLGQLKWRTVQEVVTERRLTNLIKYRTGIKYIPEELLFPREDSSGPRRSGRKNKGHNSQRLAQSSAKNSREEMLCVQQTISTWNLLPEEMVSNVSVSGFKSLFLAESVYKRLCMEGVLKHLDV
jgi:hypothetical protein